jgi:membrane protein implicated in regulation of membrane protease activity
MWVWLVVAGLAVIGELLSYDLFLAPVAVSGVVVALIAPVAPFPLQVALFGVLSLLGIVFVRPVIRHALGLDTRTADTEPVGHDNVVGRRGIVTQTVDAGSGQIRIGEGEFWTARPFNPTHTFPRDDAVEVLLIDGVTALVESAATATPLQAIGSSSSIEKGSES